jgi:prepilin-type N-terminal cleavage/methylation domain-containing protein
MMQSKQKGFTLLELLVVITLLAVLSVGALIAYEGIGDNAQATAAANNTAGVDRAIRNFRAVSLTYPNQWDSLSNATTGAAYDSTQVAALTQNAFGDWAIPAASGVGTVRQGIVDAFAKVGIDTIQEVNAVATGVAPNLQHNEGANPAGALQTLIANATHLSILPATEVATGGLPGVAGTACNAGGVTISAPYTLAATNVANDNAFGLKLNAINDSIQADECQLVIALGFGHDAAHTTTDSPAAIVTAASYSSKAINPANNYGRYVALFHLGSDGNGDQNIDATEIHPKAHLLAVVDTEGNSIDVNIAKATATN